jgi:hypothetical protein
VCRRHADSLADTLRDLAETYALLGLFLAPGSVPDEGNVRGRRIDAPAPVRLEVVALTDRRTIALDDADPPPVLAIVESWARLVREERALASPLVRATLIGEVGFLLAHHGWVCAQPWVDDYAAELRRARSAVHDAIGDHAPRPVGHCQVVDEQGECGGPLYQDRWGAMAVSCRRCGAVWQEDDLRRLGLVMGA